MAQRKDGLHYLVFYDLVCSKIYTEWSKKIFLEIWGEKDVYLEVNCLKWCLFSYWTLRDLWNLEEIIKIHIKMQKICWKLSEFICLNFCKWKKKLEKILKQMIFIIFFQDLIYFKWTIRNIETQISTRRSSLPYLLS